jgi:heme/copper-type cytochrome/quinol oxidase subunit 1
MNAFISKPHKIFLLLAIFLFLVEYIRTKIGSETYYDIPLHDTYLVIASSHITFGISILILLIGMIYWIGEKWNFKYNKIFSFLHFLTLITAFFLLNNAQNSQPKMYNNFENFEDFKTNIKFMYALAILLWSSILFFIINLILGFLNRAK